MDLFGFTKRNAYISTCGQFRYSLRRTWDETRPAILFIMLNPSKADAEKDDRTIKKCMKIANNLGYGELYVGNLFAFRSTDRSVLLTDSESKIGDLNDSFLKQLSGKSKQVVFAWGNYGMIANRAEIVTSMFYDPKCLAITSKGQPKHPLYCKDDSQLIDYK